MWSGVIKIYTSSFTGEISQMARILHSSSILTLSHFFLIECRPNESGINALTNFCFNRTCRVPSAKSRTIFSNWMAYCCSLSVKASNMEVYTSLAGLHWNRNIEARFLKQFFWRPNVLPIHKISIGFNAEFIFTQPQLYFQSNVHKVKQRFEQTQRCREERVAPEKHN